MNDRVFIDTNVLVYLLDQDSTFHCTASGIFTRLSDQCEIWISRQVLREYAVVVSRNEHIEKTSMAAAITNDIESFQKDFHVADEDWVVTENLKDLILKYNIIGKRIHDTNIVATMVRYSIPLLFTFNTKDFKNFDEIELIDTM